MENFNLTLVVYLAFFGYPMVINTFNVTINPFYARSQGYMRWKNHIPPDLLVFLANCAIILYPFTDLPYEYSIAIKVKQSEQLFILTILAISFYVFSTAIFFFKRVSSDGVPRSFIAHLIIRVINPRRQSQTEIRENIRSGEYAIVGTFGGIFGPFFVPYHIFYNNNPLLIMYICGLIACVSIMLIRRLFGAAGL